MNYYVLATKIPAYIAALSAGKGFGVTLLNKFRMRGITERLPGIEDNFSV